MPEEYFIVHYPNPPRDVIAGGNPVGSTNELLHVPTDYYTLTLDGEVDYASDPMPVLITGTTPITPMTIVFRPNPAAATAMFARLSKAKAPLPRRRKGKAKPKAPKAKRTGRKKS